MSTPSREQRLAEAEAKVRDALATKRQALAAIQSQQRAAAKKARDQRRYQVGTLVDEAGLAGLDDAGLRQAFTLVATLIRRGHLGWAVQQHEPDPQVEREVQALIANEVTLVLVDEEGKPLRQPQPQTPNGTTATDEE